MQLDIEVQNELIAIINKANKFQALSSREAAMLFYWSRNRYSPELRFVIDHFGESILDDTPKKHLKGRRKNER